MKLNDQQFKALSKMVERTIIKKTDQYKETNEITPKGGIVFAGDSMIDYLPSDLFDGFNIINRGIAGIDTKTFLDLFDNIILPIKPKYLFLSIGSNDLVMLNTSPDQTVTNIKNLLSIIQDKLPDTIIYYISATPVITEDNKIYKQLYVAGRTNQEIDEINRQIERFWGNYIDVNSELKDGDGFLELWYTNDGIHLNRHGYAEYKRTILPYLKKL